MKRLLVTALRGDMRAPALNAPALVLSLAGGMLGAYLGDRLWIRLRREAPGKD